MSIFNGWLWEIVRQVDWATIFILILFVGMSIACWVFTAFKWAFFRFELRYTQQARTLLQTVQTREEFIKLATRLSETGAGSVMQRAYRTIQLLLEMEPGKKYLTEKDFEEVKNNLGQAIDDVLIQEENFSILSVSAAVGPLIGLFGTIWGLIHSFGRISQMQSADITTVAPGIAEALITTLGGLAVAIPAVVFFHFLTGQLRALEYTLQKFADQNEMIIRKLFVQ